MYSFPSNLFLLRDHSIRKRIKSNAAILIIYDEEENEISISRDTFGTIPLYYSKSTAGFGFSTDIKFLRSHRKLKGYIGLNISKISSYLTRASDIQPYTSDTFHKGISSILPGHFVHFSRNSLVSEPLISFEPQNWEHLNKIEEFAEEFKYIFSESVRNYILNTAKVSSHLSGGLDSSSVSSMIRHIAPALRFNTIYGDTNTNLTNESHYAEKVAKSINSNHFIVVPSTDELDLVIRNTSLYGFPEHMSLTPSLQTALIEKAGMLRSEILMTGTDGDSIVGHGFNYLNTLFAEKRWDELKLALSDWASFSGGLGATKGWEYMSVHQKERLSFIQFLYPKISGSSSISDALEILEVAIFKFKIPYRELFRKGISGISNRIVYSQSLPSSIQSNQLKAQDIISSSMSLPKSLMNNLPDKYCFPFSDVFYNQAIVLNEENFFLAKNNNIELGYPFYSNNLFELSMATPASIKFNRGKNRGHLREAMRSILIDDVRNRPDKGIFNEYGKQATLRLYSTSGDFLNESNQVWDYVDRALFEKCLKLFLNDHHPQYVLNRTAFFINRTIYLSVWLNQQRTT